MKPRFLVALLGLSMVASLVTVAPFSAGPIETEPVQAAPGSTYCENIDDSDPANGPSANGGGAPVEVTLSVFDIETGADLSAGDGYSYLVSLDNTARADDPDPTRHPAVSPMASHSPTVAAGDEAHPTFTVPDGCRYLISVRAAGHQLWGEYVELPAGAANQSVTIELLADVQTGTVTNPQPWPQNPDGSGLLPTSRPDGLPPSSLVVQVFHDQGGTNGQPDSPFDTGLAGFHITVDAGGENIIDIGGSPLCQDAGNDCVTGPDGTLTIQGLPFGPYEIHAIPPDGSDWVQTTTIEGTQAVDVWLDVGTDGFGIERALLNEGGTDTAHWFGFVEHNAANEDPGCAVATCGDVTGRALNYLVTPPFEASRAQTNEPVNRPYIAVNDIGGNDHVERVVRGNADGTFTLPNLEPGTYQLAIWDYPLHYIMRFVTVTVPEGGGTVDLGDVGVWRWFGWMSGYVYLDNGTTANGDTITPLNTIAQTGETTAADFAGNGIRDCIDTNGPVNPDPHDHGNCELGLPGEEVLLKFRDGSVFKATTTDANGYYEMPAVRGPLGRYVTSEVGFARRDRTGHSIHHEFNFSPSWDPYLSLPIPGDKGGDLLLANILWEGHRTWVDWGKADYTALDPASNGGIAGAVLYGVTRNELDPHLAGQEDYEFGIPNVPVRLWGAGADGEIDTNDDELLGEAHTDAWSHPGYGDGPQPQTAWAGGNDTPCNLLDNLGNPSADPNDIAGRCLEVPANGNETQDGAWDGGFAFEDDCSAGINGGVAVLRGDPADPASNYNQPAGTWTDTEDCTHIVNGDYTIQVVVPEFFQIIKEEDVNTDEGVLIAPELPPAGCVGELHEVIDTRSPFHGLMEPLCDLKAVRLQMNQNAAVEFTLHTECPAPDPANPTASGGCDVDPRKAQTDPDGAGPLQVPVEQRWITDDVGLDDEDVPPPGRYYGFSEDGITVDNDPASLTYGEKFGVPNIPIGIYDFTGRHLITVYTDQNGYYEFLAPSSFTVSCPHPNGLCPGLYTFVPNDPGQDPNNPNPGYNRAYLTQPWVFQALPGKMRLADTPLFPISGFQCQVEQGTPQLLEVSEVYKFDDGIDFDITLTGTAFEDGANPPTVTLTPSGGGASTTLATVSFFPSDEQAATPIFEDVLNVTVPGSLPAGTYQMELQADGFTTVNGISFHVLPVGTTVHTVTPASTIQAAVDAAVAGDFLDVRPGVYRENVIVDVGGITIQGHGPGGVIGNVVPEPGDDAAQPPADPPFSSIDGTTIDSRYFFGNFTAQAAWDARALAAGHGGAPPGASITLFDSDDVHIDGMSIGFGRGEGGGGVFAHNDSANLTVSNNVIAHNTGEYGGGIVLGRPEAFGGTPLNGTEGATITDNRILENGGISRAGAIGIFVGSGGYLIANNDICGNFSHEYGGGISHFGLSPDGVIEHNRIFYNDAFDEGGGVMIAGEATNPLSTLTDGSGDVVLDSNEISYNLSNDDGGGVRLLAPGTDEIRIVNNFINHNAATDHGGGIALDDASNVFIVNNTIVENAAVSTAEDAFLRGAGDCTGAAETTCPRGAGLTAEPNSTAFQATLPGGSPTFPDPVLLNNIFWNNEAFFWGGTGVGLQSAGMWDMEVVTGGAADCFNPTATILSVGMHPNDTCDYTVLGADNSVQDPQVNTDLTLNGLELAVGPSLLGGDVILVEIVRGEDGPQGAVGEFFVDLVDMHLLPTSPAIDYTGSVDPAVASPAFGAWAAEDIDNEPRPENAIFDLGADEQAGGVLRTTYISLNCPNGGPATCAGDPTDAIDILRDNGDGTLSVIFDGSEVLLPGDGANPSRTRDEAMIDGFAFLSPTEILISFQRPLHRTLFGLNNVPGRPAVADDSDVMLYTITDPAQLLTGGGTWSWYFEGSDVGLSLGREDIDAVGIDPVTGDLLLSTVADADVPGPYTFPDEDVFRFSFAGPPGHVTNGVFSPYIDGSEIDGPLGTSLKLTSEDIDAFSLDPLNANVHISTLGNIWVGENAGVLFEQDHDVVTCITEQEAVFLCDEWETIFQGNDYGLAAVARTDIKGAEVSGWVLP